LRCSCTTKRASTAQRSAKPQIAARQIKTSPDPQGGVFLVSEDCFMIDDLLDKGQRDRSHISMGQPHEVHYWTRHLGVTKDELQRTVDKVGNSAAAVRKELGLLGARHG
jgi:hypothetical protein